VCRRFLLLQTFQLLSGSVIRLFDIYDWLLHDSVFGGGEVCTDDAILSLDYVRDQSPKYSPTEV
jgi:hypothetical protein